jgi:hypothetical protein
VRVCVYYLFNLLIYFLDSELKATKNTGAADKIRLQKEQTESQSKQTQLEIGK